VVHSPFSIPAGDELVLLSVLMKWSRARRGAEEGEHECKGRGVLLQLLEEEEEVLGMLQAGGSGADMLPLLLLLLLCCCAANG
jgi:hypothetical protein